MNCEEPRRRAQGYSRAAKEGSGWVQTLLKKGRLKPEGWWASSLGHGGPELVHGQDRGRQVGKHRLRLASRRPVSSPRGGCAEAGKPTGLTGNPLAQVPLTLRRKPSLGIPCISVLRGGGHPRLVPLLVIQQEREKE